MGGCVRRVVVRGVGGRGVVLSRRPFNFGPNSTSPLALLVVCRSGSGQHLPTDAFGGRSAEEVAANVLSNIATAAALRIIIAQEEGFGNECSEDINTTLTSDAIRNFLNEHPLRDGDETLGLMLKSDSQELRLAAVRAIEVRRTYMDEDFNWHKLRGAVGRRIDEGGSKLKADYLQRSMDSPDSSTY